ncbi:MAG: energy-coupling factor ABC transporter permease [Archaeoglobaceae archaeon]|nr:energy-coupling factor ABC transporter permease [Archaeoglobaceae archaeon]MCX8152574.1 energy-coupling factor ABC transporter permease [Archaeoglobaceae archaeon]MDW8014144.1 energy-coupling factor ABC transporter permease [Archaeoglobaceae archaeon]
MHIPDGFLDLYIATTMFLLSFIVVGISILKVKAIPQKFGIIAAAIFVAQMLDWPIPGGTSAHFMGGSLAGILLGPYAGCLAMTTVLLIQTLVFADGGLTAIGANVWNMAVVNVFLGYWIYKGFERFNRKLAAFLAGWLGVTAAAIFCGIEIGLSKYFVYGLTITVPIMAIWHAVLGIVEGTITASVASVVKPVEVVQSKTSIALIATLIALTPLFAYAAELVGYREPLDFVADKLELEGEMIYKGIIPEYTIPGLDPYFSALISAIIGTFVVFSIVKLCMNLQKKYSKSL